MSRQEDFQTQAETYANTCGGTTQEKCAIMTDYFAGAEHGYQYAVEKIFKCIEDQAIFGWIEDIEVDKFLEKIRKAMEE